MINLLFIIGALIIGAIAGCVWLWWDIREDRLARERHERKLYEETKRWD